MKAIRSQTNKLRPVLSRIFPKLNLRQWFTQLCWVTQKCFTTYPVFIVDVDWDHEKTQLEPQSFQFSFGWNSAKNPPWKVLPKLKKGIGSNLLPVGTLRLSVLGTVTRNQISPLFEQIADMALDINKEFLCWIIEFLSQSNEQWLETVVTDPAIQLRVFRIWTNEISDRFLDLLSWNWEKSLNINSPN